MCSIHDVYAPCLGSQSPKAGTPIPLCVSARPPVCLIPNRHKSNGGSWVRTASKTDPRAANPGHQNRTVDGGNLPSPVIGVRTLTRQTSPWTIGNQFQSSGVQLAPRGPVGRAFACWIARRCEGHRYGDNRARLVISVLNSSPGRASRDQRRPLHNSHFLNTKTRTP